MNHQELASWIFGGTSFVFLLVVYFVPQTELPAHRWRVLAIVSSSLVGFFGFFFTGTISLTGGLPRFGQLAVQSGGGMALFVLCLLWWRSPKAPIKVREFSPEGASAIEQMGYQNLPIYRPEGQPDILQGKPPSSFYAMALRERLSNSLDLGPDAVISSATVLLSNDQEYPLAYLHRSTAYVQKSMWKEALADADEVLALAPDCGPVLMTKVVASMATGQKEQALQAAQHLKRLGDPRLFNELKATLR